jgi:hypothetical protein
MPRARGGPLTRALDGLTRQTKSEWHAIHTKRHKPFEPSFHAQLKQKALRLQQAPNRSFSASPRFLKAVMEKIVYGHDEPPKPSPPALSTFHESMCESFRQARGGDYAVNIERSEDAMMRPDYCILHSDGQIEAVTAPIRKQDICDQFGLNPRDLRVLDGNAPASFAPTLLVRSKSIVYSSSVLRCLITPWAVHVFGASQQDDGRLSKGFTNFFLPRFNSCEQKLGRSLNSFESLWANLAQSTRFTLSNYHSN